MTVYLQAQYPMTREEREKAERLLREKSGDRIVIIPQGLAMAKTRVLYRCDRRACETCCGCGLTSDIAHAASFRRTAAGDWIEAHDEA